MSDEAKPKRQNHKWGDPDQQAYHTDRICKLCGMKKRGRREIDGFWNEFYDATGERVIPPPGVKTPPCKGTETGLNDN